MNYQPTTADIQFILHNVLQVQPQLQALAPYAEADADLMQRAKALGLTLLHKPVRSAKLRSLLRSIAAQ